MEFLRFDSAQEAEDARKKLQEQSDIIFAADRSKPRVIHVAFKNAGKPTMTIVDEPPDKVALVVGKGRLMTAEELLVDLISADIGAVKNGKSADKG